jgi:short-subunit dehydrogenase
MCRAFLPGMLERRGGHIVNVASAGGLVGFALISSYCTTKFALVRMSEAIRQEVHAAGVGVTAFCPGVTNTPIINASRLTGYSRDKLRGTLGPLMEHSLSAERTGELIVRAVKRNSAVVVTSLLAKALVLANRLAPRLVRWLMGSAKSGIGRLYT